MIREMRRAPIWAKVLLGVIGAVIVIAIIGAAVGGDEKNAMTTVSQLVTPTITSTLTAQQQTYAISVATQLAESAAHAAETRAAAPTSTPRPTPTPVPLPYKLALISSSCTLNADIGFSTCEGFVENISGVDLEDILVVIEWADANGTPRSSDDALIDYNPVLAGQRSPWTVISNYNPELTRFRVSFTELFGGTILTRDDR